MERTGWSLTTDFSRATTPLRLRRRHPSSRGGESKSAHLYRQVFAKIHVPHQPVQIIGMQIQQLGSFSEISAGLFDGSKDELSLYRVDRIVIAQDAGIRSIVRLQEGFGQIFRANVIR